MASVVFYSSFNTLADQDWPWVQTVSTATDITLTDGQHKQTFAGLFTYGAGGILNGIVTSSSYYLNNALVYSAIGMVANARQMQTFYSTAGDTQATYSYVLQGNDSMKGSAGSDTVLGYAGNDTIEGGGSDDVLDGGLGIDTAVYSGLRSSYTLTKTGNGFTVTDTSGLEGTDTLKNVERLKFSNGSIALDVGATQSAGAAQLLLGAVLGKDLLATKKPLIGTAIDLFDQGYNLQQLSGALMRLDIWGLLANGGQPAATNTQIANYLLTTVLKAAPDAATLNASVLALNAETGAAQGNFLWHLAESAANQIQVGLVGLATTGLEFGG